MKWIDMKGEYWFKFEQGFIVLFEGIIEWEAAIIIP